MPIYESPWGSLYYTRSKADGAAARRRPPLLLIAGAGESVLHWPPQLRHHEQAIVYALDLPGHGRSAGTGCTEVTAYTAVVHAFVEAVGLTDFVLAGHSMGGAVALTYMDAHADRLRGSVLVATGASLRVNPAILADLRTDFDRITEQIVRWVYAPGVDEKLRSLALKRLRQNDPDLLWGDFVACDRFDVTDRLPDLHTPTLILCGREDRMTPPQQSEFLHARLPDSRLHILDGAGHMVQLEQAGRVEKQILAFLDELRKRDGEIMG